MQEQTVGNGAIGKENDVGEGDEQGQSEAGAQGCG